MGSDNQPSVPQVADEVRGWIAQADGILTDRIKVIKAGEDALATLRSAIVPVYRDNQLEWRILPLSLADEQRIDQVGQQI